MLVSNINFQKQFYCRLYKENCTCRHDFGLVVGTVTFLILHLFSVSYFTPVLYSFVFYWLLTHNLADKLFVWWIWCSEATVKHNNSSVLFATFQRYSVVHFNCAFNVWLCCMFFTEFVNVILKVWLIVSLCSVND